MAKKKSKASAKSADRKSKQETKKYTIGDLAEELDINAASACSRTSWISALAVLLALS